MKYQGHYNLDFPIPARPRPKKKPAQSIAMHNKSMKFIARFWGRMMKNFGHSVVINSKLVKDFLTAISFKLNRGSRYDSPLMEVKFSLNLSTALTTDCDALTTDCKVVNFSESLKKIGKFSKNKVFYLSGLDFIFKIKYMNHTCT